MLCVLVYLLGCVGVVRSGDENNININDVQWRSSINLDPW